MTLSKIWCLVATLAIVSTLTTVNTSAQEKKDITGGMPFMERPGSSIAVRTILLRPKQAVANTASKLFPTQDRIHSGNAAPIILRQNFEANRRLEALRKFGRTDFLKVPLEQLDPVEVTNLTPIGFGDLRRAAFRERAGWEYPTGEGNQGLADVLLPDVAEIRGSYIKAVAVRARVDVLRGNLNDAMDKICIGLGISKHVGETPFVVCKLNQAASASDILGPLEELIQHPASENQYWHLAGMPAPFVDTKPAIQLETYMWEKTVTELASLDSITSAKQWDSLVEKVKFNFDSFASETGLVEKHVFKDWERLSRERLPAIWKNDNRPVASMCDSEVWVRYWHMRVQAARGELMAWALLDFHEAIPKLLELRLKHEHELADELPVKLVCGPPFGPSIGFVTSAASVQQHIDLIRTIESIRDWSAKNGGKLPNTLQELDLPAPVDCILNNSFAYGLSLDGHSATLQGAIVENRGFKYELELD